MMLLRAFHSNEFERACAIKQISGEENREKFRSKFDKSGVWDDHFLNCAIDVDGVAVGEFQARHCDRSMPPGTAEVGIEILPEYQGRGLGTQVLLAGAAQLFAEGFHRLSGSTDVDNIAMQKAFQKAGWRFEGIQRHLMPMAEGLPRDYRVYSRTKFDQ